MTLAIIGGTGLGEWQGAQRQENLPLRENRFGSPSGAIKRLWVGDHQCLFLARHGNPHAIPPHRINYRANLQALADLGVRDIIAVNAVGGIGQDFGAGTLAVADDLIDYTSGREHTIYSGGDTGLDHIDFSWPYSQRLRSILIAAAKHCELAVAERGVYACTNGPRLETAAEVRKLKRDGADLIGMTGMPEAALARELGMDYACLSLVVNPAAGETDEEITMAQINAVLAEGMDRVRLLLSEAIARLAAE